MNASVIDLRSDTVTVPCAGMRRAMAEAEVGDDVYAEDPTANRLQDRMAEMAGHEAGLFFPSGTQSNLAALLSHCRRGEEYIVGQDAHTYKYEGGGAAVLGSIQPQPLEFAPDGTIPLDRVRAAIKEDDFHFAVTRLLALENTTGGRIVPQGYIDEARALTRDHDLRFHLDGARVFNAAVGTGPGPRRHHGEVRLGFHLPVQGPRSARGFGAGGVPRAGRPCQALAQDGGRRHAPGGGSCGRLRVCPGPQRGPPGG